MKPKSFAEMRCPVARALEVIGDRWTLLILRDLFLGLCRHDDLSRSSGIPPTTLSSRLRQLEQQGLVAKRPYQTNPPRYEYVLTPTGRAAWPILLGLAQWGNAHGGLAESPMEFVDARSGHDIHLEAVDTVSGERIPPESIEMRAGPGADELARWRVARGQQARHARAR
jgi:DNA-binding HxlR family transcriptional regulator